MRAPTIPPFTPSFYARSKLLPLQLGNEEIVRGSIVTSTGTTISSTKSGLVMVTVPSSSPEGGPPVQLTEVQLTEVQLTEVQFTEVQLTEVQFTEVQLTES